MSKLTNAEKDKLDNTCGNLRVTKLGTHVKTLEDFVNEGVLDTRANTVVEAINELYGMIVNKDCEGITIPPPGFFTLFGNDEDGKLYVYYNNADYPPQFRHVETPGELEGTLYLYIADPLGENHYELEVGHYIAVRHLDNYYTKAQINSMFTVTVEKQTAAESGSFATYVVKQGGTQVGTKINIPKDYLVKSCSVKTCTTANVPVQGYKVGDKYIDWVINTRDGSANNEHLYLLVNEIAEPYKPDNSTITMSSGNVFSVKDGGITLVKLAPAVQNLINSKADANHAHGNITKEGKVGTNPNVPLITGTDGIVQAGSFGSGANNFARGNHGHSDLASIAYVDNQIASVEGDVVIDLESKADKNHTHNVIDLTNYMPISNDSQGTEGYLKILNIKTNQLYLDDPITFEIYQRKGTKPIYCSLKFVGGNNADPTVDRFTSEGSDNEVYVYKASQYNWQVIVKKIASYDHVTVENINCNWGRWSSWATNPSSMFTHLDETITSLPSNTSSNPLVKATYSISDVLTDTDTDRSLSANQGNVLKGLIDGKSPNDHNHDSIYLKIDNGVFSGSLSDSTDITTFLSTKRSFIGSFNDGTNWWNVISARHRNGASDGTKFGMYIRNQFGTGNLLWRTNSSGNWGLERTILDSSNYSNYANKITKTSQLTNDGDGTNVFVKNNDSKLTNPRDPINNAITANSDLDDFKDTGFYYCQGDAEVAPTIVNQPLTSGGQRSFSMIVELISSSPPRVVQKLTYYSTKDTYIRTNINGEWSTWNRVLHSGNYSDYANKTTVTDNLTTDSSTNALSAKQGKWLYDNKASSSHAHGNISNTGAIGTTANLPVITTTSGKLTTGSFGNGPNTFCEGNDSRITNAVKSACKIGFSTSSSAPGDAMNLSVAQGNPLYAFVRDANGNVPTGLAGGAFLFNGSPRSVTINSNGIMSLNMNTAGTFIIHAIVSDGDGYQVAAGFCRITVS